MTTRRSRRQSRKISRTSRIPKETTRRSRTQGRRISRTSRIPKEATRRSSTHSRRISRTSRTPKSAPRRRRTQCRIISQTLRTLTGQHDDQDHEGSRWMDIQLYFIRYCTISCWHFRVGQAMIIQLGEHFAVQTQHVIEDTNAVLGILKHCTRIYYLCPNLMKKDFFWVLNEVCDTVKKSSDEAFVQLLTVKWHGECFIRFLFRFQCFKCCLKTQKQNLRPELAQNINFTSSITKNIFNTKCHETAYQI